MTDYDVAIIGGGFSGLLTLAHMVARAPAGARYAVFEPRELGQGLAYSTRETHHLLNVNAGGMSAFPDQPGHLLDWLSSDAGRVAAQSLGVGTVWTAADYIPRALYALYLRDIADRMRGDAKRKGVTVDHIRLPAADVSDAGVTDTQGTVYPARRVLLALGNLVPAREAAPHVVTDVFGFDYKTLKGTPLPVVIVGSGLTMVDTLLSLRAGGYEGVVHAFSRRGLLPHVHDEAGFDYASVAASLAGQPLHVLMRACRSEAKMCMEKAGSWQPLFKQWRPHLPALWAGLNLRDRKRFLSRLFTLWNVHRHRMAGQIGAVVRQERASGRLLIHGGSPEIISGADSVTVGDITAAKVFDCRGPGYDVTRSDNPLLLNMLKKGMIAPHPTGWGIMPSARISAIGTLLIGERLETTAVPELRVQAKETAISLCG